LALGPLAIDRGDRDLVADPSVIVVEEAVSIILSSGESDALESTLGISLLTRPFETNVWCLVMLNLLVIILYSSIYTILRTPHVNKKSFIRLLIRNSFEYSRNLIRQCKLMYIVYFLLYLSIFLFS